MGPIPKQHDDDAYGFTFRPDAGGIHGSHRSDTPAPAPRLVKCVRCPKMMYEQEVAGLFMGLPVCDPCLTFILERCTPRGG